METPRIVLPTSFLEFEWISSPEAVSLYIYLLLTASSGENMIFGNQVHRGQVLTLRSSLMRELGISSQKITTAIRRLIDADCISLDKIRKYYLITLKRYDDYSAIPK